MPYMTAIAIGLVVGIARGGHLAGIARLRFGRLPALAIAFLLWIAASPLPFQSWLRLAPVAPVLYLLAHVILLWVMWENRHIEWLPLVGLGLLANAVAVAINAGQMPVDAALLALLEPDAAAASGEHWVHYRPIDGDTRLPFLGDIVFLGPPYPWQRVLSPSDILVALGGLLIVQAAMARVRPRQGRYEGSRA